MTSRLIKIQTGQLIIEFRRIEVISMNGKAGAMYEPTISMPGVTWTWGRRWVAKKTTDAQFLESEWVERVVLGASQEFPEFASE